MFAKTGSPITPTKAETPKPRPMVERPEPAPVVLPAEEVVVPPSTGTPITVRLQPELLIRLDLYRKLLNRQQAIRQLLFEHLP